MVEIKTSERNLFVRIKMFVMIWLWDFDKVLWNSVLMEELQYADSLSNLLKT